MFTKRWKISAENRKLHRFEKDPNKTGNKQYSNYNEKKKNSVGMVNGRLNTLAKENS